MTILINPTGKPIETKHICWNVRDDNNCLVLEEIVEKLYEHPDSGGMSLIPKIEVIQKRREIKNSYNSAPLHLLLNALNNISIIEENK